jgi:predicted DNA-binding mobile mystery protein A
MKQSARHSHHQLDEDLGRIRAAALAVPPGGWLRGIREALGMSMAQLGRRMGLPRQGVLALEQREASGAVSLKTLREAAAALDAELVYAIVPRRSLARMLQKQARRKAGEELAREQWATAADLEAAVEKRAAEWLLVRPRALWDDKAILPTRRLRSRKPVPAPVPAPFRPQPDAT